MDDMNQALRIINTIKRLGIEAFYIVLYLIQNRRIVIPFCTMLLLLNPDRPPGHEFPVFRVVLDPGHGGIGRNPMSLHGDRFDAISGRYLDFYKEGASRGGLHEGEIVYRIASKTKKYLQLLAPGADKSGFFKLIEKYSKDLPRKINISTYMSREQSLTDRKGPDSDDPNAPYRLFDYPDREGSIRPGRLTRINEIRPHLVVCIHLANRAPRNFEGINPVITPYYDLLHKGLLYLKGNIAKRSFYYNEPGLEWFVESVSRSDFAWFLNDTSLYFTGYPLKKNLEPDRRDFKGYRYNMIQWSYADAPGWKYPAQYHLPGTRYSDSIKDFEPEGKFWDRERSAYERFRRKGGPEGFGGDNAYASYEIARYILYSLHIHGEDNRLQKPGKSYISTWIMPLHVNAVCAFIELGYLSRPRDRFLLTRRQDEIAQGIAMGIYSLLAGMAPEDTKFRYLPRGKKLELSKYRTGGGKTYFDEVSDD
jgi:hypothetical protein